MSQPDGESNQSGAELISNDRIRSVVEKALEASKYNNAPIFAHQSYNRSLPIKAVGEEMADEERTETRDDESA